MTHRYEPTPMRSPGSRILAGAFAFVLALAAALMAGHLAHAATSARLVDNPGPLAEPITPSDVAPLASRVVPGLVDINSVLGYQGAQAMGTGIVLTPNGEILTNNHVVAGATRITVTDLANGRTYPGSVVGYDRTRDTAVVQLRGASGLHTATLGNSSSVTPGEPIAAIGNAGGRGTPTIATGTVTGLNQSVTASDEADSSSEQLSGLIQVDADVEAGDSGGALVNNAGQVIGMNTAASAGYQLQTPLGGISINAGPHEGFAIPINQATATARQITSGHSAGSVHVGQTAFMGVSVTTPPQGSGAQVARVIPRGPAAKAGLPQGAVITAVDGRAVNSPTALTDLMGTHVPGERLQVAWVLGTARHVTTVIPVAGPVG